VENVDAGNEADGDVVEVEKKKSTLSTAKASLKGLVKRKSAASPKVARESDASPKVVKKSFFKSIANAFKTSTTKSASHKSSDDDAPQKKEKPPPGKLKDTELDLSAKGAVTKAGKAYKCELMGNKWMVDNATAAEGIIELSVTMRQSVYIYNANEATIVVNGKCNSIAVDKCFKTKVLCDTLVSMLE
jgi:hypothetical protein